MKNIQCPFCGKKQRVNNEFDRHYCSSCGMDFMPSSRPVMKDNDFVVNYDKAELSEFSENIDMSNIRVEENKQVQFKRIEKPGFKTYNDEEVEQMFDKHMDIVRIFRKFFIPFFIFMFVVFPAISVYRFFNENNISVSDFFDFGTSKELTLLGNSYTTPLYISDFTNNGFNIIQKEQDTNEKQYYYFVLVDQNNNHLFVNTEETSNNQYYISWITIYKDYVSDKFELEGINFDYSMDDLKSKFKSASYSVNSYDDEFSNISISLNDSFELDFSFFNEELSGIDIITLD